MSQKLQSGSYTGWKLNHRVSIYNTHIPDINTVQIARNRLYNQSARHVQSNTSSPEWSWSSTYHVFVDLLSVLLCVHAANIRPEPRGGGGAGQTQPPADKELNRSIAAADGGGDQINPSINPSINQSRGGVHSAACTCKPAYFRFALFNEFSCDKLIYKSTITPCSHCQCQYSKLKP